MKYFLHDGKNHVGPFEIDELKNKDIKPEDLVWWEGAESWLSASQVPELKKLFTVVPPSIALKSPPPIPQVVAAEVSAGKKVSKSMIAVIVVVFILIAGAFIYSKVAESMKQSNEQSIMLQNKIALDEQQRLQDIQSNAVAAAAKDARIAVVEQNISSHVSAYENQSSNLFGKVTSSTLIVSNTSDYTINECVITVISKSSGHEPIKWKETLQNIKAGTSATKLLPTPSNGTSYELKITRLTNTDEQVYLNY